MLEATGYIKRLTETTSVNEKKAIIREAAINGCTQLFLGFQLAYDKRRIFGVRKAPIIEGDFTEEERQEPSEQFDWNDFLSLIMKLESERLVGQEALKEFRRLASIACIDDWNLFYRPIIMKNMKCGTKEKTINNVLNEIGGEAKKYLISIWGVQQGKRISDSKNITGRKALDPIFSGHRRITILNKDLGTVTMYTVNGNKCVDFSNIINDLKKLLDVLPINVVLDGEIVNDTQYALFDMLSLSDFEVGYCPLGQMDRHDGLIELIPLFQECSNNQIYVVPKLLVDLDTKEGHIKMNEFYVETFMDGNTGIMIKNIDAPYICKRGSNWLKWIEE